MKSLPPCNPLSAARPLAEQRSLRRWPRRLPVGRSQQDRPSHTPSRHQSVRPSQRPLVQPAAAAHHPIRRPHHQLLPARMPRLSSQAQLQESSSSSPAISASAHMFTGDNYDCTRTTSRRPNVPSRLVDVAEASTRRLASCTSSQATVVATGGPWIEAAGQA
jgi:hypothetical protein